MNFRTALQEARKNDFARDFFSRGQRIPDKLMSYLRFAHMISLPTTDFNEAFRRIFENVPEAIAKERPTSTQETIKLLKKEGVYANIIGNVYGLLTQQVELGVPIYTVSINFDPPFQSIHLPEVKKDGKIISSQEVVLSANDYVLQAFRLVQVFRFHALDDEAIWLFSGNETRVMPSPERWRERLECISQTHFGMKEYLKLMGIPQGANEKALFAQTTAFMRLYARLVNKTYAEDPIMHVLSLANELARAGCAFNLHEARIAQQHAPPGQMNGFINANRIRIFLESNLYAAIQYPMIRVPYILHTVTSHACPVEALPKMMEIITRLVGRTYKTATTGLEALMEFMECDEAEIAHACKELFEDERLVKRLDPQTEQRILTTLFITQEGLEYAIGFLKRKEEVEKARRNGLN